MHPAIGITSQDRIGNRDHISDSHNKIGYNHADLNCHCLFGVLEKSAAFN